MKQIYDIEDHKPLADVMPTVGIRAKDLATEMTTVNTERHNLHGKNPVKEEHVNNNAEVARYSGEAGYLSGRHDTGRGHQKD